MPWGPPEMKKKNEETIVVNTTADSKVELDELMQVILTAVDAGGRDVSFAGTAASPVTS